MNTKHTPGPWAIDAGLDGAVIYNGSGTIANVPEDLLASSFNARLIAAAPELLEALIGLLNAPDPDEVGDATPRFRAVMKAHAAIAKAYGEVK